MEEQVSAGEFEAPAAITSQLLPEGVEFRKGIGKWSYRFKHHQPVCQSRITGMGEIIQKEKKENEKG